MNWEMIAGNEENLRLIHKSFIGYAYRLATDTVTGVPVYIAEVWDETIHNQDLWEADFNTLDEAKETVEKEIKMRLSWEDDLNCCRRSGMKFTKEKMLEYLEEKKKYWDNEHKNHSYTEGEDTFSFAKVDLLEDLIAWVKKQ